MGHRSWPLSSRTSFPLAANSDGHTLCAPASLRTIIFKKPHQGAIRGIPPTCTRDVAVYSPAWQQVARPILRYDASDFTVSPMSIGTTTSAWSTTTTATTRRNWEGGSAAIPSRNKVGSTSMGSAGMDRPMPRMHWGWHIRRLKPTTLLVVMVVVAAK